MTKVCKKCKKEFNTDTKEKLCERCKNKQVDKGKKGVGILATLVAIVAIIKPWKQ